MKRMTRVLLRSVPVFLIIIVTLFMSVFVYSNMIGRESEKCWDWLSVATRTMGEKVGNSFSGNLTLLEHVADAVVLKVTADEKNEVLAYLRAVQENPGTIFSRIDILLPDSTLIMQTGETFTYDAGPTFEELALRGTHISTRVNDRLTGIPSVYCCVPVRAEGEIAALLLGLVDCQTLPEQFPSYSYDGKAQIFLMDRADGSYLMDTWHSTLGNVHELGPRQMLKGYENVDFNQEILNGAENGAAFISRTDGQAYYMYYMPVEGFNWSIAMMVQENQLFESVNDLRHTLLTIGLVAGTMLVIYLLWNMLISSRLVSQEERLRRMEVERITNQAKSTFLSSVSHDIRTPLNGIVGMLDVIERRGGAPGHIQECLDKIGISTQYLISLADDVLDLTEIESGKLVLNNAPFDLRVLAEELDVLVQSKAEAANIACHTDLSAVEHPRVIGSMVHLRRILINLVTNAIKYNRESGQVWVTFAEQAQPDGSSRYVFSVRDTGIGMTREFQERMFQSFTQEQAGARTHHRGHGLGLTIVSRLLEQMGGEIQVQSEKGKGSVFTVILPLEIDPAPEREASSAEPEIISLSGLRMLLVEDNELNMEIARLLLGETGAMIETAVNGKEAVDAFAAAAPGHFQLILMDIMMPEMDGLEATRQIRRMKRSDAKSIPIIAMTANAFAEDVQRCHDAGMNAHVSKPLNMTDLTGKIARLCQ